MICSWIADHWVSMFSLAQKCRYVSLSRAVSFLMDSQVMEHPWQARKSMVIEKPSRWSLPQHHSWWMLWPALLQLWRKKPSWSRSVYWQLSSKGAASPPVDGNAPTPPAAPPWMGLTGMYWIQQLALYFHLNLTSPRESTATFSVQLEGLH